ncbi:MAG: SAM-dependent methyltransferase, partial [Firmicutes bacterium]|nr:SAM-dependent methyltransferase [Bacillota bacterium]
PQNFFNSVYKVLKPNGRLILRDMTAPEPVRWFMNTVEMPIINLTGHGDVKVYGKKDVQGFCDNSGLKIELFEQRGFFRMHCVARKVGKK